MRGVDVLVRAPFATGAADALGNPVTAWGEPMTVGDVLVQPGATSDAFESNRPEGATVVYTLAFPASFSGSLRGCEVRVPGDSAWYAIAGDPKPVLQGQLRRPLRWNRECEAVRADG